MSLLSIATAVFVASVNNNQIGAAADSPVVAGDYMEARPRLLRLGFRPMKFVNAAADRFKDWTASSPCFPMQLPEGYCAADVAICHMFWRAPNGRVLMIETRGEKRAGAINSIAVAKASELVGMQDDDTAGGARDAAKASRRRN